MGAGALPLTLSVCPVLQVLLERAEDFVDNVTKSSCLLAKHRKSSTLEVRLVLWFPPDSACCSHRLKTSNFTWRRIGACRWRPAGWGEARADVT